MVVTVLSVHNTLQNRGKNLSVLSGIYQEIQSVLNRIPVETKEARAVLDFSSDFLHTCDHTKLRFSCVPPYKGFTDTEQLSI